MARRGSREILAAFGRNVRSAREERGLSQEALALRCALDRTYIGGVERGERNLGLVNLVRIAESLGVDPASLLVGVGSKARRRVP